MYGYLKSVLFMVGIISSMFVFPGMEKASLAHAAEHESAQVHLDSSSGESIASSCRHGIADESGGCHLIVPAGPASKKIHSLRASGLRQEITPAITIAASRSEFVAGLGQLDFTLTRGGDATNSLDITVEFVQTQSWLPFNSYPVTFDSGETETTLSIVGNLFSSDVTQSGDLTASVGAVSGYGVADTQVTVRVISQEGPAVTVSLDRDEYEVSEGAGEISVTLVAKAAAGVPYVDEFLVLLLSDAREAVSGPQFGEGGDFVPVLEIETFSPSDFDDEEGRLVARKDVRVTIKQDDIAEGDETFVLDPLSAHPNGRGSRCAGSGRKRMP